MTTSPAKKTKKTYDWHEEDRYYEVLKDMNDLDIDLFLAIADEKEKANPDQVRLKKLQSLRTELLELLKNKHDIEHYETLKAADLRIFKALEELSK